MAPHRDDGRHIVVLTETTAAHAMNTGPTSARPTSKLLSGERGIIREHNLSGDQIRVGLFGRAKEISFEIMKNRCKVLHPDDDRKFIVSTSFTCGDEMTPTRYNIAQNDSGRIESHVQPGETTVRVSIPSRCSGILLVPKGNMTLGHRDDEYPYRANSLFKHPKTGEIQMMRGDEGKIFAHSPDASEVRVSNPRRMGKTVIVVPRSYVDIASGLARRKFGDWQVRVVIPPKMQLIDVKPFEHSPLFKFAVAFFEGVKVNHEILRLQSNLVKVLGKPGDTDSVREHVGRIMSGIHKAGLGEVLQAPQFTLSSIIKQAKEISIPAKVTWANYPDDKDCEGGIYMFEMSGFTRNDNRGNELYIGSTKDFKARIGSHVHRMAKGTSCLYRAWRVCSSQRAWVLCRIPPGPDAALLRYSAELMIMNALDTYITYFRNNEIDANKVILADDDGDEDDDGADKKTTSGLSVAPVLPAGDGQDNLNARKQAESAARFIDQHHLAICLARISKEASTQSK